MNFKILKKDLRRKKSMNIILLILILLAATFSSSSINNMIAAFKGTDNFFTQAGMKDFLLMTMRENYDTENPNDQKVDQFLMAQDEVQDYTVDECQFLAKSNLSFPDNKEVNINSTMVFQSFHIKQQKFFDQDDQVISDMEDGQIYIPLRFMSDNNLKKGDSIIISSKNGYKKEFTVAGYMKDAFMGADMMGSHRYLLSVHDFTEMAQNAGLPSGMLYSVTTNDLKHLKKDFNDADIKVMFSADQTLVKATYLMDMIIAAVLLLVSLCLILISIVMLRFIILFTINEDYKEIGIMKAIGIGERTIRKLYVSKYLLLAGIGALLGFITGIPFSRILLKQVSQNIVLGNLKSGIGVQLLACLMVVLIITLFAYLSTRKIKKLAPMDAIRSGNRGERFKKKGLFRLSKSRRRATTFLACNDVMSELRKYIVMLITSVVGMWLIIMPINTINTLHSERMMAMFSIQPCDLWLSDDESIADLLLTGNKQAYYDYLDDIKKELIDHQIPVEKAFMEVIFRYRIRKNDSSFLSTSMLGIHTDINQYAYEEGTAPQYPNEVALANITADEIDAKIGDTVYITTDIERPYIVTARYQSMNNMGEGIRFHENAEMDYRAASGGFGVQITLQGQVSPQEYDTYCKQIEAIYPNMILETPQQRLNTLIGGISERLDSLKILTLTLVIAVNVLVVVLMQKMFLIRERGEMAMMKSVGFSNGAIIGWHTKRIALVLITGILIGALTGTPFSQITAGQAFKIMGASKIEFLVNPLEVYAVYPLLVFVFTLLACVVTMRKVRTISVKEINNME